jgi:hybrid cluster-associated redox disulfide protein
MEKITKDMVIGDILDKKPDAQKVIAKYFGQTCFTCPGSRMESLELGASMHGLDANQIVKEINELDEKK